MKNITLSEFLGVALKKYALNQENPEQAQLIDVKQNIHSTFYELFEKYKEHLPVLNKAHFENSGAFPHSKELSHAIDNLYISGLLVREIPNQERFRPTHYPDTSEVIGKKIDEIFENDCSSKRAFYSFVEDLGTLKAA